MNPLPNSPRLGQHAACLLAIALLTSVASAATLVEYNFSDAPLIAAARTAVNRTSAFNSKDPLATATALSLVNGGASLGRIIATAADSSFSAAQISDIQTTVYSSADPYLRFTVGNIDELTSLIINARGGAEWQASDGALTTGRTDRLSNIGLFSSVDGFAALVDGQRATTISFADYTFNLAGLAVPVSNEVTFRLQTVRGAGSASFHRTQFNDVELTGVAIPEPTTFAMLLGGFGMLTLLRRRSRRNG